MLGECRLGVRCSRWVGGMGATQAGKLRACNPASLAQPSSWHPVGRSHGMHRPLHPTHACASMHTPIHATTPPRTLLGFWPTVQANTSTGMCGENCRLSIAANMSSSAC